MLALLYGKRAEWLSVEKIKLYAHAALFYPLLISMYESLVKIIRKARLKAKIKLFLKEQKNSSLK